MPYLDIFILAVVCFFIVKGWIKGFFLEFFTLVGFVVASIATMIFNDPFGSTLASIIGAPEKICRGVTALLLFLAISFGFGMIGRSLGKATEKMELTHINRTLGMLFGAAKGILGCGVVVIVLTRLPISAKLGEMLVKTSFFCSLAFDITDKVLQFLKQQL